MKSKDNAFSSQIDLIDLFKALWGKKMFIFVFTSCFAIFSVIFALSLPNIYQSTTLLSVVDDQGDALSSLNSRYGSLASVAGFSLPTTSDNKSDLAMETIRSRDFLKHLISFEDVLPKLMATERYDPSERRIQFNPEIYDSLTQTWTRKPTGNQKSKPSYLEAHEAYLDVLSVSKDDLTGYITVSVNHLSPEFSYELLSLIINETNSLIRTVDLERSTSSLDYLNEQLLKTQQSEVRASINVLIKSQLETIMMAKIDKNYILRPLDSPYIPEKKSFPSRSMICILITFLGGMLSVLYVLITHYTSFELSFLKRKTI